MLFGFGMTLALGLLVLVGASVGVAISAGSNVLNGVNVAGVELTGLDRSAAAERLGNELPALDTGAAVVSVGETEIAVPYADLGRGYETDTMLDAALGVGRSGNPIADAIDRLRSLLHPTTLPVVVHAYDADALASIAGDVAAELSRPPREAAVLRDGATFTVRESAEGQGIAEADVASALGAAVDNADPADVRIELTATTLPPVVDTATAEAAAAEAEAMASRLKLTIPGADDAESLVIKAATLAASISFGPEGAEAYTARVDPAAITAAVNALATEINQAPVNARIGVAAGGGLGGVIAGQDGRRLDVADSSDGVLDALARRAGGASVGSLALVVNVTEPSLTTAEAEAILPQMQMVSTWTTNYVPGEGNGFGNNINIGAFDIDGRNMAPGEWFSFWDSIGPVTPERGYQYGGVIIGGRSVAGGAIGGGICSTSTTIFNAALRMGLEMGDPGEPLLLHRPLPRRPRRDGVHGRQLRPGHDVPQRHRVSDRDPRLRRQRLRDLPDLVGPDRALGRHHRPGHEQPPNRRPRRRSSTRAWRRAPPGASSSRTTAMTSAAPASSTTRTATSSTRTSYFSSYRTVNGITAVGPKRAAAPPDDGQGGTAGDGDGGSGDVPPEEP